MKITVLGCGRWGSFLAWYVDSIGHSVYLWGRQGSENLDKLITTKGNGVITLSDDITISSDLEEAIDYADYILISISSQQLRDLMDKIKEFNLKKKTFVLCMKGLEEDTGKRLTEIVAEYVPCTAHIAIWVGPGHVEDFLNNIPNCMVIDSQNEKVKKKLVKELSSKLIRFYYGNDIIGNELGAASKNVIGIAAGMLDGLGFASLKGALMSRGTHEISRLIKAMGGNQMSAYGLAHLGDYEATVFSKYSHNRKFGELFVQGKEFDKLAEGVSTSKAIMNLCDKLKLDMPICEAVHSIINLGKSPEKVLSSLFLRIIKTEF